ncbi:c-type cytochrome, partial [Oligoflexia bacterium]|nr:c-type cytochrome [Oligoflexia bacterium]
RGGSCARCHGPEGEGISGPALADPDFLNTASDGYIMGTAILGRENTEMPAFYKGEPLALNQIEIQAVTSYIRSFADRDQVKTRTVVYTPEAIAEGQALFKTNCGRCHGDEGLGSKRSGIKDFAPALNNQGLLKAADDGFFWATVVLGREGTKMPSFTKGKEKDVAILATDEIKKVVAFMRSWEKK